SDRHAAYVAMGPSDGDASSMRADVFYCRTAMDGVNVMNTLRSDEDLTEFLTKNHSKLQRKLANAEQRAAADAELLSTLPRREVSAAGYVLPDAPRFGQKRIEYSLDVFAEHIDQKTLYSLNWRFGGAKSQAKSG